MNVASVVLVTVAWLLVSATVAHADEHLKDPASLEQVVIEQADTPLEHRVLAREYRAKAHDMQKRAARHRSMAEAYKVGKMHHRERMQKHCDALADSFEQAAAEYQKMAAAHEEASGS